MTYRMILRSGVLVLSALISSAAAGSARQPQTIVRKPLLDASIAPDKMVHTAKMVSIDFAPAQRGGAHIHPIPVVGYVLKGSITFEVEGQPARTLSAGDAFLEPANVRILAFDNASPREPASFIACYLMGADDHDVIKALP